MDTECGPILTAIVLSEVLGPTTVKIEYWACWFRPSDGKHLHHQKEKKIKIWNKSKNFSLSLDFHPVWGPILSHKLWHHQRVWGPASIFLIREYPRADIFIAADKMATFFHYLWNAPLSFYPLQICGPLSLYDLGLVIATVIVIVIFIAIVIVIVKKVIPASSAGASSLSMRTQHWTKEEKAWKWTCNIVMITTRQIFDGKLTIRTIA